MPKTSDEEYEKIMADLKARLDQIEVKQKTPLETGEAIDWTIIITLILSILGLFTAAMIYGEMR